jgi:hypothetical protein
MFSSPIIDVTIGFVFCYAALALTVSTITEAIASGRKWRSTALFGALKALLNDSGFNGLALKVFNHALVSPLGTGNALPGEQPKKLPSYVPSIHFATALIDAIRSLPGGDFEELKEDFDNLADPQLRQVLQGIYAQASLESKATERLQVLQKGVANLFDNAMDRLSGEYKRQTQAWTFGIAVVVAVIFNIDSLYLLRTLWIHPSLTASLTAPGETLEVPALLWQLSALPVGWEGRQYAGAYDIAAGAIGILISGVTSVFGAPFWFDALQKLTRLRGTGPKAEPEAY